MHVDRAFTISGFGTVVTGTAYHGTLRLSDKIEILPSGIEGRVRTLQVHNQNVESAFAGQRVAINLAGINIKLFRKPARNKIENYIFHKSTKKLM